MICDMRRIANRSLINTLIKCGDKRLEVTVQGRVTNLQNKGNIIFLHISDGYSPTTVQAIISKDVKRIMEMNFKDQLRVGSSVSLLGDWVKSRGTQQSMELAVQSVHIDGTNDTNNCPLQPKTLQSPDELRQNLHIRPMHTSFASLIRLRSVLTSSIHLWFMENGYVHVDAPLITRNDSEAAGEAFSVEAPRLNDKSNETRLDDEDSYRFFGHRVFLPVSSQLHLEVIAGHIPRVYTINPAFRAERSLSRRHLAEFRMIEAEMAFVKSTELLMQVVEQCIAYCALELKKYEQEIDNFRQVYSVDDQTSGLRKEHEQFIVKHFGRPVFVTDFPIDQKPFYMKRSSDGAKTLSFDLFAPFVGEIAGGSVREDDYQQLVERIGKTDNLQWYADLRRFGSPPTGGFGIGMERLLQSLLGIYNIKDTVPFPRWYKHCHL